jgi:hypothetical protein
MSHVCGQLGYNEHECTMTMLRKVIAMLKRKRGLLLRC